MRTFCMRAALHGRLGEKKQSTVLKVALACTGERVNCGMGQQGNGARAQYLDALK